MIKVKAHDFNFTERAKEVYYHIKKSLAKKYPADTYICIEPKTGSYIVGKSAIEVMEKSEKKYPSKQFFVAQLGRMAGLLK